MNSNPRTTLIHQLEAARHICIITHMRPDGDAYGTMLGLALSLSKLGKNVRCFNQDGVIPMYRFLPGSDTVELPPATPPEGYHLYVDCSTLARAGSVCESWNRKPDANLDHHGSNSQFAKLNLVEPHLPAAALLAQLLIEQAGWPVTHEIATNLYTGLSTDTGSFRYRGTNASCFQAAARLVDYGADSAEISRLCYQSIPISRFQLHRRALESITFSPCNQLATILLTPSIFEETQASRDDTEGLVEQLLAVDSVRIAAVFEILDEQLLRASLRAKPGYNVARIAEEFGGGGHELAAGIRLRGNTHENRIRILQRLEKEFPTT